MKAIVAGSMFAMLAMTCNAQAPADVTRGKKDSAPAAEKAKSKEVPKMTTAEKDKMAKDVNQQMVNPDHSSGRVFGTGDFPPYGPRKVRPHVGGGPEIFGK